jgi:hypothetical protein
VNRYGAALSAVVVAAGLSGCGAFVAPNSAHAPLKASLAAEALYAGPVKLQPREVARLGTPCAQTPDCRLGEAAPRRAATIGAITVLEPSDTGTKLRAPWIRWTQLYRAWDAGFSRTYTLDSNESGLLWEEGETERNKGLFQVFRDFGDVTRLELVLDQNRFRYDLSAYGRDVLVGRIRALLKQRTAATADRTDIEQQIRAHLELLAATEQRADARVKRLEAIAREEADLYAAFAESIRTLDGLQRNITNHLIGQDLVLSAEEARALAEAIQERFKRIREAIEAGRKAGVEEAAQAKPPEWADRVRGLLDELRPKRKE